MPIGNLNLRSIGSSLALPFTRCIRINGNAAQPFWPSQGNENQTAGMQSVELFWFTMEAPSTQRYIMSCHNSGGDPLMNLILLNSTSIRFTARNVQNNEFTVDTNFNTGTVQLGTWYHSLIFLDSTKWFAFHGRVGKNVDGTTFPGDHPLAPTITYSFNTLTLPGGQRTQFRGLRNSDGEDTDLSLGIRQVGGATFPATALMGGVAELRVWRGTQNLIGTSNNILTYRDIFVDQTTPIVGPSLQHCFRLNEDAGTLVGDYIDMGVKNARFTTQVLFGGLGSNPHPGLAGQVREFDFAKPAPGGLAGALLDLSITKSFTIQDTNEAVSGAFVLFTVDPGFAIDEGGVSVSTIPLQPDRVFNVELIDSVSAATLSLSPDRSFSLVSLGQAGEEISLNISPAYQVEGDGLSLASIPLQPDRTFEIDEGSNSGVLVADFEKAGTRVFVPDPADAVSIAVLALSISQSFEINEGSVSGGTVALNISPAFAINDGGVSEAINIELQVDSTKLIFPETTVSVSAATTPLNVDRGFEMAIEINGQSGASLALDSGPTFRIENTGGVSEGIVTELVVGQLKVFVPETIFNISSATILLGTTISFPVTAGAVSLASPPLAVSVDRGFSVRGDGVVDGSIPLQPDRVFDVELIDSVSAATLDLQPDRNLVVTGDAEAGALPQIPLDVVRAFEVELIDSVSAATIDLDAGQVKAFVLVGEGISGDLDGIQLSAPVQYIIQDTTSASIGTIALSRQAGYALLADDTTSAATIDFGDDVKSFVIMAGAVSTGGTPIADTFTSTLSTFAVTNWWKLDEPSGSVANDSGSSADGDGTLTGAGLVFGEAGVITPNGAETSLGFFQTGDVVTSDLTAGWETSSTIASYSVGAWFRLDSFDQPTVQFVWGKQGFCELEIKDDGTLTAHRITEAAANKLAVSAPGTIVLGQRYFAVVTFRRLVNVGMKVYLNGVLVAQEPNPIPTQNAGVFSQPFNVGRETPVSGENFDGHIQHVFMLEDVELQPTQILNLYQSGNPVESLLQLDIDRTLVPEAFDSVLSAGEFSIARDVNYDAQINNSVSNVIEFNFERGQLRNFIILNTNDSVSGASVRVDRDVNYDLGSFVASPVQYEALISSFGSGPSTYWRLGDVGVDIFDEATGTNTGLYQGAVVHPLPLIVNTGDTSAKFPVLSRALANTVNQFAPASTTAPWSFVAWFRTDVIGTGRSVLARGGSIAIGWTRTPVEQVTFLRNGAVLGGTDSLFINNPLPVGSVFMIAATWSNSGGMALYLNDQSITQPLATLTQVIGTAPSEIAGIIQTETTVDEAAFFDDYVLTQADVQQIFALGSGQNRQEAGGISSANAELKQDTTFRIADGGVSSVFEFDFQVGQQKVFFPNAVEAKSDATVSLSVSPSLEVEAFDSISNATMALNTGTTLFPDLVQAISQAFIDLETAQVRAFVIVNADNESGSQIGLAVVRDLDFELIDSVSSATVELEGPIFDLVTADGVSGAAVALGVARSFSAAGGGASGSGAIPPKIDIDRNFALIGAGVGEGVIGFEIASSVASAIITEVETLSALLCNLEDYLSLLEIWNGALAQLGVGTISATTDSISQAVLMSNTWNQFKGQFLADHTWNGAVTNVTLTKFFDSDLVTPVVPVGKKWSFAYVEPADYVRALRINGKEQRPQRAHWTGLNLWGEEIVQNDVLTRKRCIVTDESPADMEYIFLINDNDVTMLSSLTRHAMSMGFAAYLSLSFGKSPAEKRQLEVMADDAVRKARRADSAIGTKLAPKNTSLIDSRR